MSRNARLGAIIFALVCPTVVTVAYFVLLAGQSWGPASYAIGKTVQFAFPLFWFVVILREKLHIGWPDGRGIVVGVFFGLVVAGSMLALYHLFLKPAGFFSGPGGPAEEIREKVVQLRLDTPLKFAAASLFYVFCHSLLEEYYWRWFVFGRLREVVSVAAAIAISSLGFMAHHVILLAVYFGPASPATYLFSVAVAVGGAVWAWLYQTSDSLYGPWLSHLLVDAAIFVIGYDLIAPLM